MLKGGIVTAVVGILCVLAGVWAGYALAAPDSSGRPALVPNVAGVLQSTPTPRPRQAFDALQSSVTQLLRAVGASGAVTLTELGGSNPQTWSYNGSQRFAAASTYKLPLLMQEAQNVTSGRWKGTDTLCYTDDDYEDGYYDDYDDGICLSRSQLENRAGRNSDNTAAHILVRYAGGPDALNRYARAHGAQESAFFDPNTTTTNDLARLWVEEAAGRAGGRAAQRYLYPMLMHTAYEQGIPAGVPKGVTVVHKIGILGGAINDAALIPNGPRGAYVLTICTDGPGGDAGWKLLADISSTIWQFESAR